jgi:hypothetical protein
VLWRVYVDESGDRGRASGSSEHFNVSAVIVRDSDDAAVRAELATAKSALALAPTTVLHFHKLSHGRKVRLCREMANFSIAATASVIVCKRKITPFPSGGMPYITNPDPLYLWAVRLLLERVSWYIRDHGGGTSIVTFAHLTRFKAAKLHNYRQALFNSNTSIHWASFDGHPFRFNYPSKVEMLQVADTMASALRQAVEPDPYGVIEDRYLSELSPLLYRYGSSPVTKYGLKTFPSAEGDPGGSLVRLRNF